MQGLWGGKKHGCGTREPTKGQRLERPRSTKVRVSVVCMDGLDVEFYSSSSRPVCCCALAHLPSSCLKCIYFNPLSQLQLVACAHGCVVFLIHGGQNPEQQQACQLFFFSFLLLFLKHCVYQHSDREEKLGTGSKKKTLNTRPIFLMINT